MRRLTVTLLSLVFAVGCGDCGENNGGGADTGPDDTGMVDMAPDAGADMNGADMNGEDAGMDMAADDTGMDAAADMMPDLGPLPPLAFGGFLPTRGPVEGGPTVTVRGDGFETGTRVHIDGEDVGEVTVLDRQTLTFTLPPHPPGPAEVTLIDTDESVTFGETFDYDYFPGPSGGAIADTVTVRVTEGRDALLPDAFVMLGTDPTTDNQGFTDADGLIEFSGLDGDPVTVVAAAVGHSSSMIVDVNAADISVSLLELEPDPITPDTRPTASASGEVLGWDTLTQPEVGESFQARVRATQRFISNPAPGADNLADDTEPGYSITTRIGEQRVVAFGGLVDDATGDFTPEKMGLSPRVIPATDEELQELDITMEIDLDQTLDLEFADDPTLFGDGYQYEIQPFVDLGYAGKVSLPDEFLASGTSITLEQLPALSGPLQDASYELRVNVVTGGGTRIGPFLRIEDVADPDSPVQVSVAAQPSITMPADGMWSDMVTWELIGTRDPDFFSLATLDASTTSLDWSVVLPPDARSVTFPQFPDFSAEPPERQPMPYPSGTYAISLSAVLVGGFDYNSYGVPGLLRRDTAGSSPGSTGAIRD